MTKEQKELLLKDLCARLPYGLKCYNINHVYGKNIFKITDIRSNGYICGEINDRYAWAVFDPSELKPYLFPLSSMTEEQKSFFKGKPIELDKYGDVSVKDDLYGGCLYTDLYTYLECIDYLNANHLDYRGLIEQDLAIDATGLGIYP